jgi:hypothetical protein
MATINEESLVKRLMERTTPWLGGLEAHCGLVLPGKLLSYQPKAEEFEITDARVYLDKKDHEYYAVFDLMFSESQAWILGSDLMKGSKENTERVMEFLSNPDVKEHVAQFHPVFKPVLVPTKKLVNDTGEKLTSTPVIRGLIIGVDPNRSVLKNTLIVNEYDYDTRDVPFSCLLSAPASRTTPDDTTTEGVSGETAGKASSFVAMLLSSEIQKSHEAKLLSFGISNRDRSGGDTPTPSQGHQWCARREGVEGSSECRSAVIH